MKDQLTAYTEMKQEVMMMIGMIICEGGGRKERCIRVLHIAEV